METTNTRLRVAFLVAAVLLLALGLSLFAFAEAVATLPATARASNAWPWPIGPLALRFVASILLAGALASYLVSRRPDPTTVAAFASVLAILSGAFLIHLLANTSTIDWSKPLAIVWAASLALGLVGGLLLLARARQARHNPHAGIETPASARNITLFIFVLTGLVGGTMFLLPDFGRERWPWDLANSTNVQLLGALFLGVSLSSLLSWLQPSWYGYDIFFPAAGLFTIAALASSFMHWNLFLNKPLTSWIFVAVYALGVVLGFYPYFRYGLRQER